MPVQRGAGSMQLATVSPLFGNSSTQANMMYSPVRRARRAWRGGFGFRHRVFTFTRQKSIADDAFFSSRADADVGTTLPEQLSGS